jgi:hypothetical protein
MTFRISRRSRTEASASTALAAIAVGFAVLALTGCANIQHALQHEHEESFAGYHVAAEGWVGVSIPAWIPDDATDLHNLATDNESVSVVRVTTATQPVGCTDAERHGVPSLTAEWSSDDWPDDVLLCGDYEVTPLDGGWLGWFNAAAEGDTPEG